MEKKRHVHFNEIVTRHTIYAWSFAYREARKGDWQTCILDRIRFLNRIRCLEHLLENVLSVEYRKKIFMERYL